MFTPFNRTGFLGCKTCFEIGLDIFKTDKSGRKVRVSIVLIYGSLDTGQEVKGVEE